MPTVTEVPAAKPLGTEKISKLLTKFAVPSIIAGLVSALYNIVDQIFIGQGVGMLGNAATNVAFPLSTICTAIALLLGLGSASNMNLRMGEGQPEEAGRYAANGFALLGIFGVALAAIVLIFLEPLMNAFGATEQVLPYAMTYTGITAIGMPFLIFSTGGSSLIRADGNPTYSMICMLSGAILNTILDPIFIFVFDMGMAGAALATIIGQIVSAMLVLFYIPRYRTVKLRRPDFRPRGRLTKRIMALGAAACFNQLAMTVVQIVMNNTLTHYGALSRYGAEIPLASVGVVSKVNILLIAFVIGIAQGNQPIVGYNYGARNFKRVREAWKLSVTVASVIAVAAWLSFQLFPRQIISIFGQGSPEYFEFAIRYLRVYMLMAFMLGFQPVTSNFFTSIGKAKLGIVLSLSRQIIVLLPLLIIFPMIWGIEGVMYAGPISDAVAAVVAIFLISREFRNMKKMEAEDIAEQETAARLMARSATVHGQNN